MKSHYAVRAIFRNGPYHMNIIVICDDKPAKEFYNFSINVPKTGFCARFAKADEKVVHRYKCTEKFNCVHDLIYEYVGEITLGN